MSFNSEKLFCNFASCNFVYEIMKTTLFKEHIIVFFKSLAMGTVNAIPGVSGGTIAMITGIFTRIINSIKSFDLKAIKLLFKGKFREFEKYTDFLFLLNVIIGNIVAIVSLAKLFEILFRDYPVYIWAYFFGLVFASIFFLGKVIKKWNYKTFLLLVIGTVIAIYISFLKPAVENDNLFYLMLCGAIAICCKILPGTSGAFVLILMGNYQLIMIESINYGRFEILVPFILGALVGLIPFSHFLSWLLNRFHDSTTALLTGIISGSLLVLWPWKKDVFEMIGDKKVITGYDWNLPEINSEFFMALIFCILGIVSIFLIEFIAKKIMNNKA